MTDLFDDVCGMCVVRRWAVYAFDLSSVKQQKEMILHIKRLSVMETRGKEQSDFHV